MKKSRSSLWVLIVLSLCLLTACGRTTDAWTSADNEEVVQEVPEEPVPADGEPVSGEKEFSSSVGATDLSVKEPVLVDGETAYIVYDEAEPVLESVEVIFGDEQFEEYLPLLEGKRVALYTNHTGIVGDKIATADSVDAEREILTSERIPTSGVEEQLWEKNQIPTSGVEEQEMQDPTLIPFGKDAAGEEISYGQHILDALVEKEVRVEAVFCPEHGFRGTEDAGAGVDDSVDDKTGVPIISLFGSGSRAPGAADMDRFDILVVDMQDVGLRYYTYYITMYHLMDACAAAGKEVLILDRPNPNGFYVDGPILQDAFRSGIGALPLPVVHGMTLGELAQMINGEGWLAAGADACDLTVIPCRNYTHRAKIPLISRPSPNLKDMRAVYLYASTCFFENTLVSEGRGTENPFEIYGSPYLEGLDGFEFSFTPQSMSGASNPSFKGETCWGVDLRDDPIEDILSAGINLTYLIDTYHAVMEASPGRSFWGSPDGNGQYWIDKLSGSAELRLMIEDGATAEEIKDFWQEDIEAFREQREPYLLYEE